MWDFGKYLLIHYWPWILIGAMVLFFFVSILAVSRLEKHFIHQYVPAGPGDLPPPSPYFQAMNDAAPALGYQPCGNYLQSRGSKMYQCCLAFWLSPDQNTLLVICGGKVARVDYKKTMLFSVIHDEHVLVTMDDFGIIDLSGIRDIDVVLNADLMELHERHLQRLAAQPATPKPFSSQLFFNQYEEMEARRVEKMASMGLAEFIDLSHAGWCYTYRGAWASACEGYLKGLAKSQTQADRLRKKRPGGG